MSDNENLQNRINNATDSSQDEKFIPVEEDCSYPLLGDVMGDEKLHKDLDDIIINIQGQKAFDLVGVKPNSTYFFYGREGNGKSFAVKAIKNQLLQLGHNVLYHPFDIERYGTAYINEGAKNVQKYFDAAYEAANKDMQVLMVLDEVEVLLGERGISGGAGKEDDKVTNAFNKNIQYCNDYPENKTIIMCTNYPKLVDTAVKRSQRIGKMVHFPDPDYDTRKHIIAYQQHFKNNYVSNKFGTDINVLRDLNYDKLAEKSEGFNVADIVSCIENSLRNEVRKFLTQDKNNLIKYWPYADNDSVLEQIEYKRKEKGYDSKGIGFL